MFQDFNCGFQLHQPAVEILGRAGEFLHLICEFTHPLFWPTLFMDASTASADTPLRQAWPWCSHGQAGGLAPRGLNILFQVCLGLSGLHAPVSLGVLAVSSRSAMNNVGKRHDLLHRFEGFDGKGHGVSSLIRQNDQIAVLGDS